MHDCGVVIDKGSDDIGDDLCGRDMLKILSNRVEVHQAQTLLIVSAVKGSECFVEPSH